MGKAHSDYKWLDEWADLPSPEDARHGWAHHGVVVTAAGEVVAFHPSESAVLVFDPDGSLRRSFSVEVVEGHGITVVDEDGGEVLWIADPGAKMYRDSDGSYKPRTGTGQAIKVTLDGEVLLRIGQPDLPVYDEAGYRPTWVAVDEEVHGGSGDVWVADGYGASYVHRFDSSGKYLTSVNGEEGAGRFNCPHAIFIDRRRGQPELYVADRGNARVQVYDLDGTFLREVGEGVLTSPSAFAGHGDLLYIGELKARVVVLDRDDKVAAVVGENEAACDLPGWPNSLADDGKPIRNKGLRPGAFNSPHGLAVDADGNVYVAEWLIGGRYTKLVPEG